MNEFERRDLLLNKEQISLIEKARIAVFGLGGVGGYALEALARMGIISFVLIDGDDFEETNLNRQLYALNSTLGKKKTEVAKSRLLDINPKMKIDTYPIFFGLDTMNQVDLNVSFIVDCIDDVDAKVLLIKEAKKRSIPIVSMMGAGNRIHADFKVSDVYKTSIDPLAKKMREVLRKEGVDSLTVVYSEDKPLPIYHDEKDHKERTIGSLSYVVAQAGLKVAEEVINEIIR